MSNNKKVLITATVQSHIAQFHKPLADLLHANGFVVHVAAKNNLALKNGLKLDWADRIYDIPFSRSPKSADNIRAYKMLREIIENGDYAFVHCNTPMGGIVTRLAAKGVRARGCKVIYTAHGFHFHKRASKFAWMVYYSIEKFFARFTDKLVTINHEDYALAKKNFGCDVYYTHGVGVNDERYRPLRDEQERELIQNELDIPENKKVILSVGEMLPNKNQQMAIKAMKKVVAVAPDAMLILAGNGPQKDSLQQLADDLGLSGNIRFIGYCTHLEKYQKIASLLVACSYREGLPLNLVEAMLAKNPVVATHNRGHDELIKDGQTGFLVEPNDIDHMADCIVTLLNDEGLHRNFGEEARAFALNYTNKNVSKELKRVYGL